MACTSSVGALQPAGFENIPTPAAFKAASKSSKLCSAKFLASCVAAANYWLSKAHILLSPAVYAHTRSRQVRLSTAAPTDPSSSWCCQVKLRKEYGKDNNKLDTKPKEEVFATLNQVQLIRQLKAACKACCDAATASDNVPVQNWQPAAAC